MSGAIVRMAMFVVCIALGAAAASAATVSFGLVGVVTETTRTGRGAPNFDGAIGTGVVSFDRDIVAGIGNEVVRGEDLDIAFTIFNQSFDTADDRNFSAFPALLLLDGTPRAIDFGVSEQDRNPVHLREPLLVAFFTDPLDEFDRLAPGVFGVSVTAVSAAPIPLPAGLPLALGGAGLLLLLRLTSRRRRG